jgi:hypothetical protein
MKRRDVITAKSKTIERNRGRIHGRVKTGEVLAE